MSRPSTAVIDLDTLRSRTCLMFYGIREHSNLGSDSQTTVDEIINDGYERFLNPPVAPGMRKVHKWGFLRPYQELITVSGTSDYAMPEDFGGLDGDLYYPSANGVYTPISKTDPSRIMALRQITASANTSQSTRYAIATDVPSGSGTTGTLLMLWPTPDGAYTLTYRYFLMAQPLTDENPIPACEPFHNQTLMESCLAIAEERLEDGKGVHAQNFMERLIASIMHDREKYSPDHMAVDRDRSDNDIYEFDRQQGSVVTYTGY